MSCRSVAEHALTVYYDGNADLAGKVLDLYRDAVRREAAEEIRDEVPRGYCPCADLIDPEVRSDGAP